MAEGALWGIVILIALAIGIYCWYHDSKKDTYIG